MQCGCLLYVEAQGQSLLLQDMLCPPHVLLQADLNGIPSLLWPLQGIFQGLYFGLGQGLGALVGGLLKNRFDGQIMFALCSGICLTGWTACVVAEHFTSTAHASDSAASLLQSGGKSCMASAAAAGALGEEGSEAQGYHGLQKQQQRWQVGHLKLFSRSIKSGFASLVRLVNAWGPLESSITASGLNTSPGDHWHSVSRGGRLKYSELASKDSGPDLSAGVVGMTVVGDACDHRRSSATM